MRINLRGGVWKNSEDEVLKAAVMKYGLNNWARVASLLSRKTARQCKARWYEWIDPAVRKTEWTLEEEERLLHLAKVFPSQWRTIAPLVGRTAHQCLQHYEKLLDIAQGKSGELADDDPRKLRPGDIDPAPETKPSRADAVDMDEDELEMLAEARARLANTRGKKAKRKAREKQMEAAKRLAQLQKKRELKAAGIGVSHGGSKKNKGDMYDHAVDIAFEKKPGKGPFSTVDENPQFTQVQKNVSLQKVEGIRRDAERKRLEEQDRRRLKKLKEDNLPEALKIIDEMNSATKRKKFTALVLPEPELAEEDVLDIVKIGHKGGQFDDALNLTVKATAEDEASKLPAVQAEKRSLEAALMEASTMDRMSEKVPDRGLREEEDRLERQKRQRDWEMLQSQPVQRKLPRPVFLDKTTIRPSVHTADSGALSEAELIIIAEMKALVAHDCVTHPMAKGLIQTIPKDFPALVEDLSRDQIDAAEYDINVATSRLLQWMEKNGKASPLESVDLDAFLNAMEKTRQESEQSDMQKVKLEAIIKQQEADIKKLNKQRNKYNKVTAGYGKIMDTIREEREQLMLDIVEKHRNICALEAINAQEERGFQSRINEFQREIEEARREYNSLQDIAMAQ